MTFTTRPEITGTFGAVTSTHWIASAVGMGILERGGNAFDAAVATGFTLQVVEPHLNGPGGEFPAIFRSAKTGKAEVLCAQGTAPAGATIAHYLNDGLTQIPGSGLLATVIPGAFDGWMMLLRDHGTMPLRDVLEPAIYYARHGHPILPRAADAIAERAAFFTEHWPTSAASRRRRRKRSGSAADSTWRRKKSKLPAVNFLRGALTTRGLSLAWLRPGGITAC